MVKYETIELLSQLQAFWNYVRFWLVGFFHRCLNAFEGGSFWVIFSEENQKLASLPKISCGSFIWLFWFKLAFLEYAFMPVVFASLRGKILDSNGYGRVKKLFVLS